MKILQKLSLAHFVYFFWVYLYVCINLPPSLCGENNKHRVESHWPGGIITLDLLVVSDKNTNVSNYQSMHFL